MEKISNDLVALGCSVISVRQMAAISPMVLFMEVANSAPETGSGLFVVDSEVAETVEVIALRLSSLGSVSLDLDDEMAEAGQFEYFGCFFIASEVTRNNGMLKVCRPP